MTTALVVEANTKSGPVLDLVSKHPGWSAETVADGTEALRCLAHDEYEVLLTEADAVRSGEESFRQIRERYPNLPVIVVANPKRHDATVHALMLGAATFVPHDRLSRDLVSTVERVVALCCPDDAPPVGESLRETTHRYEFPNERDGLAPVLRHVQVELERFQVCDRADRLRVVVALEESIVNAIVHGNLEVPSALRERGDDSFERLIGERRRTPPYSMRRARLTAAFRKGEATFVVSDEGPGFDPEQVPDPTDPENLIKPHGRGLLLMRTFMNEVRHNAKGNEVTLVKRAADA